MIDPESQAEYETLRKDVITLARQLHESTTQHIETQRVNATDLERWISFGKWMTILAACLTVSHIVIAATVRPLLDDLDERLYKIDGPEGFDEFQIHINKHQSNLNTITNDRLDALERKPKPTP